jgi:hypothetical protein
MYIQPRTDIESDRGRFSWKAHGRHVNFNILLDWTEPCWLGSCQWPGIEFADFTYTVEEILSPGLGAGEPLRMIAADLAVGQTGDIFTSVHLRNSFMDEMNKADVELSCHFLLRISRKNQPNWTKL